MAWEGEHGGLVYLADSIDKKERKVVLSPLHATSNLELQLNSKKFMELKKYIKDLTTKYAMMKINYEDKLHEAAIDLIEEIDDFGEKNRAITKILIYWAILKKAGFMSFCSNR